MTVVKRPTRSQVIGTLIFDAVLQARLKWNEYAGAVVDHYHAHVDAMDRVVEFHVGTTAENFDQAQRLNTQTVRRILSGEIRMCVDIEESLVAALPDDHRNHLMTILLARSGLLLARVPPPATERGAHMATPCELLRSTASAVEQILPMLEDGSGIGVEDSAHFATALQGIHRVMGACITISTQISDAMVKMPGKPARAMH